MSANLLNCTNKGCYIQDYHKLDVNTDTVLCLKCGKSINITIQMKKILRTSGQTMAKAKSGKEVLCKGCNVSDVPVIFDHGQNKITIGCKNCLVENDHLTKYFQEAYKLDPTIERVSVKAAKAAVDEAKPAKKTKESKKELALPTAKKTSLSGADLLKRAGFKLASLEGIELPGSLEQKPANKPAKVRPATDRKPASAKDMLERAGFKVAEIPENE